MAMARCLLSQTPHLPPSARALTAAHPPAPSQPASLQRYNGHPPTGARFRLPAAPPVGAELPFHQPDLMAAPPSGDEPTRHRAQGSGCRPPRLRRRATSPLAAGGPYSAVSAAAAFGLPTRAWTHPLPWLCSSSPPARQWRASAFLQKSCSRTSCRRMGTRHHVCPPQPGPALHGTLFAGSYIEKK
nr:uncharacterized protein LOC127349149 isoform X2 [Lolium perenne]